MKRRRILATIAAGAVAALALSACSANPGSTSDSDSFKGKTLNVWLMQDDLSQETMDAAAAQFAKNTGATAKIQVQQWSNINTKLATTLSQANPPDIVAIGSTDVPLFTTSGALLDLTPYKKELQQGQQWVKGIEQPGIVDGKLYAAPAFGGAAAVMYNKKIWADAGITAEPTSWDEFTHDLDLIKAKNPDPSFSAFYLPGKWWFGGIQQVWDAGGDFARLKDGKWVGAMSTPESLKGLAQWRDFMHNYSTASSRAVSDQEPDESKIFADGKAATFAGPPFYAGQAVKYNPSLEGQIGSFPMPSQNNAGQTQRTFVGGSNLGIPVKSSQHKLALQFLKVLTSEDFQEKYVVDAEHLIPASQKALDHAIATQPELNQAFYKAAENAGTTPITAGWATIETDDSVASFFATVATDAKPLEQAAKEFDAHLEQALNKTH